MNIIFWQNSLSIHQLPYVARLIDIKGIDSVTFVAGTDISADRRNMGWNIPQIEGLDRCHVIVNPNDKQIESLLTANLENSVHLFSGIRGFAFVFKVFRESLKYELTRGLIVESPNTFYRGHANGKPLWLHRLVFKLRDAKYSKYIKYIFAMGEDAVQYYQGLCKNWEVYPFAYCTESPFCKNDNTASTTLNCLFIGSLMCRKSVSTILTSYTLLPLQMLDRVHLKIVGNGPEMEMLKEKVKKYGLKNVEFMGAVANDMIGNVLAYSDVLILPSIYDGWGAVVNEALCNGCYAIVSDRCGAKELLNDKRCGRIFQGGNPKELASAITYCVNNISDIRDNRAWRKQWADKAISGKVLAQYMADALNGKNPIRPWLQNS